MSLVFTVLLRRLSRRRIGEQYKPPPESLLLNLRPFSKGCHHASVAITDFHAVSTAKNFPITASFVLGLMELRAHILPMEPIAA